MLEGGQALEFEWDETKRQQVLEKHKIDLLHAALIFDGPVVTRPDLRDYGEERFISTGMALGRCVVVVYTERAGKTRLISAWFGGRKDYGKYKAGIARRDS